MIWQDLIVTLQSMLPLQVTWPNSLQMYDGCLESEMRLEGMGAISMRQVQQTCMRSCRQEPFHFQRWEDNAAWLLCSFDAERCTYKEVELSGWTTGVRQAALNYSVVVKGANSSPKDMDVWQGHQYCFFVTLGQALPFVFVFVAGTYLLAALLKLPFVVISAGTQLLAQIVSFTHARG